MGVLSSRARKQMPTSDFAEPGSRKYPIADESHGRNALARVAQHGTSEEKAKVRAAVHRKFPDIKESTMDGAKKWRPKKSEEEAPKEEPRRMARIYANKAKKSGKPVERKEGGRRSLYPSMMRGA